MKSSDLSPFLVICCQTELHVAAHEYLCERSSLSTALDLRVIYHLEVHLFRPSISGLGSPTPLVKSQKIRLAHCQGTDLRKHKTKILRKMYVYLFRELTIPFQFLLPYQNLFLLSVNTLFELFLTIHINGPSK